MAVNDTKRWTSKFVNINAVNIEAITPKDKVIENPLIGPEPKTNNNKEKQASKDYKKNLKKNLDNPATKKRVQNKKVASLSNKKSKKITKTSDNKPIKKT